MKHLYILIAFIFFTTVAKAQFGVGGGGSTITGRISGTVIDSVTNKPVDYATISLFRSGGRSPITGVVTDENGNFKLDNVKPGKYKVTVGFIGYITKTIDPVETTDSKPDNKIGRLLFSPSQRALKEVSVVGASTLIENKIDKIVYNAEKDITVSGGNATDVLQKVPLVNVDINGNVSIRGDGNVRVLINGKPSGATSASLSDVLKTIPADQIKSVEVVTSPSAKYDAEGSGGIINIITKQKNISGISGGISGGIGTRQNNGNLNLNYNKNRFSLSLNAGGNLTWPQTTPGTFYQKLITPAHLDSLGKQIPEVRLVNNNSSTSTIKRHGAIGSVTAGYEFNAFNSINSTFRLNDGGFTRDGSAVNNQTINEGLSSIYTSSNNNYNHFGGFDWNIDYTHKFKKEGHEITVSGQWSHSIITADQNNAYSAINPSQISNNKGTNNEYTLQADYTLPISKLLKLEAGGKTIQRRINSKYDIYNTDNLGNNAVFDAERSNLYGYNQNVYAGYTVLTFTLPKNYSILAGSRVEETRITGNPQVPYQDVSSNLFQNLQPFSQNYTTYIPSLTIQKQFGSGNSQTIKLAYSKRIQRPSLTFLNPFIDRSNVQGQSVGNPSLSPETTQTVELSYNTFIKSSLLNFSVYYKTTNNLIEGIAKNLTEVINGDTIRGTRTEYSNIGTNKSFGGSFFGSISPVKALTIRANINAFSYNPTPNGAFVNQASKTGTYMQYSAFGSGSYQFTHNIIAEAFGFINSSRRTIQGTSPSFGIYAFAIKKQFHDKKASIGFTTVQPFANDKHFNQNISSADGNLVQRSTTAFPFRSFGINFSYSFGKVSFSNPNPQAPKKGVNNDDTKQGDQGGGMGGGQ